MTVAIDITAINDKHQTRGIGIYTKCLTEALKKYVPNISYKFITRGEKLPNNVNLVHYPYFEPFFLTLPLLKPLTTVVTVHDLIPIVYSKYFPPGLRGKLKWQLQKLSLMGSSHIITDSYSAKKMITTATNIPEEKISVIYLAPKEIFSSDISKTNIITTQKKYNLPDNFLIYVGDVNWNKNIQGLIKAFSIALKTMNNLYLVLAGKTFLNDNIKEVKEINLQIDYLKLNKNIIKTGFVPDNELHLLYFLASACLQPSFAEGFGLPVLEAMASGCPCIVSRNTSLEEIAGPGILVSPSDEDSIANGILTLFKKDLQLIRQKSREWAKQFTWKNVALQTSEVYKKIIRP